MRERAQNAKLWGGEFSTGDEGKFQPALTFLLTRTRKNEREASEEPGLPQPLFEAHLAQLPAANTFQYDVTTGAKRFLLNTVASQAPALQLTVVSNWETRPKK